MKRLGLVLPLAAVLMPSAAQAGPVQTGETVKVGGSLGILNGGAFWLDTVPYGSNDFLTFCLEKTESSSPSHEYEVVIATAAVGDGGGAVGGKDELDSRIA